MQPCPKFTKYNFIKIQIWKFQHFCKVRNFILNAFGTKLNLQYLKLETKVQSRHREVCNWTHHNWPYTRKNWGNTVSVTYGLSAHGHDQVIMTNGHKKWLGRVSVNRKHKSNTNHLQQNQCINTYVRNTRVWDLRQSGVKMGCHVFGLIPTNVLYGSAQAPRVMCLNSIKRNISKTPPSC